MKLIASTILVILLALATFSNVSSSDLSVLVEIAGEPSIRGPNYEIFDNGDGTNTISLYSKTRFVQDENGSWVNPGEVIKITKNSDDITFHFKNKTLTMEVGTIFNDNYFSMAEVKGLQPNIAFSFPSEKNDLFHKYALNISNLSATTLNLSKLSAITLTYKEHSGFNITNLKLQGVRAKVKNAFELTFDDLIDSNFTLRLNKSEKRIYIENLTSNIIDDDYLYLDPTIQLVTPDSQSLDDANLDTGDVTENRGGEVNLWLLQTGAGDRNISIINKFEFPFGGGGALQIEDAVFSLWLGTNGLDAGESFDATTNYVADFPNYTVPTYPEWTELNINYNERPTTDEYNTTGTDTLSFDSSTGVSDRYTWNITGIVQEAHTNSDNTISIWLIPENVAGSPVFGDFPIFSSRETQTAGREPYINITYSVSGINITYVDPTDEDAVTIDPIADGRNYTYINTTIDGGVISDVVLEWNGTNATTWGDRYHVILHLDGNTTTDDSGRGNDFIRRIGTNCSNVEGYFSGGACKFDGNNTGLDSASTSNWLDRDAYVEAWIKLDSIIENDNQVISARNDGSSTENYIFMVEQTTGILKLRMQNDCAGSYASIGSTVLSADTWYHVAFWVDEGVEKRIYINGNQEESDTNQVTFGDCSITTTFGYETRNNAEWFNGTIDEIRIILDELPTPEEINISYRSKFGKYYANVTDLDNGTYTYNVYANDTFNLQNSSGARTITFGALSIISLNLNYTFPTDNNSADTSNITDRNWTYINVSVTNTSAVDTFIIEWNGTNITAWGNGLIGLWHFNNDTNDSSGNGNDGIRDGGIDCSTTTEGRFRSSCDFDGDGYVNISSTIETVSNLTVSVWFKVDAFDSGWQTLIAKGEGSNWRIARDGTGNNIEFSGLSGTVVKGTTNVNDGEWHSVIGVHGFNNASIYIDGRLEASAFTNATPQTAGVFSIGENPGATGREWNGSIDEVRIYNRALTKQEIDVIWRVESGQYFANITDNANGTYTFNAFINQTDGLSAVVGPRTITFGPNVTEDLTSPVLSNFQAFAVNGTFDIIGGSASFNTTNLEEIEYMLINFTLTDPANISDFTLFFSANGSGGCSLGNLQSNVCYNLSNAINMWIRFHNGTITETYDGTEDGGNQGDQIEILSVEGPASQRNYSIRIDEHYNPNVFKWYSALFNFSDVKWQDATAQRITKGNMIKVEINDSLIPLNADQYKLDVRINISDTPSDSNLLAFACNSSYTTGNPAGLPECALVSSQHSSEFMDDGTKHRSIFTNDLVETLGNIRFIILDTDENNPNRYYTIRTYNITNTTHTQKWEFTQDNGGSWANSNDGYESELNINWFINGGDPTQTMFRIESNDSLGNIGNSSDFNITWDIDPTQNYPPVTNIDDPAVDNNVSEIIEINWTTEDPNDDFWLTNITLVNGSGVTELIASNLVSTISKYNWTTTTHANGTYNLTVLSWENETTDGFASNNTHEIFITNVAGQSLSNSAGETFTFIDIDLREFDGIRQATDILSFVETILRTLSGVRSIDDIVRFIDSILSIVPGQDLSGSASDELLLIDSSQRTLDLNREFTNSIFFSGVIARQSDYSRSFDDIIRFVDDVLTAIPGEGKFTESITDVFRFVDETARLVTWNRLNDDIIRFVDSSFGSAGRTHSTSDSIRFTDGINRQIDFTRELEDSVFFDIVVNRIWNTITSLADRIIFGDRAGFVLVGGELTVTIVSPENLTYAVFPPLNFTVTTTGNPIDVCWYNINNGDNITLADCNNLTSIGFVGHNALVVFVNDTQGTEASGTVGFSIDFEIVFFDAGMVIALNILAIVFAFLSIHMSSRGYAPLQLLFLGVTLIILIIDVSLMTQLAITVNSPSLVGLLNGMYSVTIISFIFVITYFVVGFLRERFDDLQKLVKNAG